jgi:hypothetical protein
MLSMWNWDGADWHELHPATLPPAGYRPTMVYDSANHQLVMALTYAGSIQTWIYTGSTWVNRSS